MEKTLNKLVVDQIFWSEQIDALESRVAALEGLEMRVSALETLLKDLEGSIIMSEKTPSRDPADSPRTRTSPLRTSPLRNSPPRSNGPHQPLPRGPFRAPPSGSPSPFRVSAGRSSAGRSSTGNSSTLRPASSRSQVNQMQRRSQSYGPAPSLDPTNGGEYPPNYGPLPSKPNAAKKRS